MKVIICGGRNYMPRHGAIQEAVEDSGFTVDVLVCGEAHGVDAAAKAWAASAAWAAESSAAASETSAPLHLSCRIMIEEAQRGEGKNG